MFHLTHERLDQLLHSREALQLSAAGRERLEWIAEFVRSGESISETCLKLNIARSTFHRWLDKFDPSDLSTLEEHTHAPHEARTSNVSPEIIAHIRAYREASPLLGKELLQEKLLSQHGISLSASTIGRIIERECLYFGSTPLHWRKRMMHETKDPRSKFPAFASELRTGRQDPNNSQVPTFNSASAHIKNEPESLNLQARSSISCICLWCSFWKSHGRGMRRTLGLASLAVNIAIISLYLATALWEQSDSQITRADILTHQTGTVSNLDAPPFNEQ